MVCQATHKRWQRMARGFYGKMGYFWEMTAAFWLSQQEFSMGHHVSWTGLLATLGPGGWITEAPSRLSGRSNLNHALQSTNAFKYLCKIRSVSSLAIFQRAKQRQKIKLYILLEKNKIRKSSNVFMLGLHLLWGGFLSVNILHTEQAMKIQGQGMQSGFSEDQTWISQRTSS